MVVPTRAVNERRARKHIKHHRPEILIVDLKDHVMGRAAAVIAKQLLLGKKITVVRCEKLTIAGSEMRNKVRYLNFLKKKKQTNPKLGPFHHRAPSAIFTRVVRSMLPRYTKRGKKALRSLVAYEGVPANVVRQGARVVIPKAQRHQCQKGERGHTVLGEMCQHIGWKYNKVVQRLEAARVAKSTRHYKKQQAIRNAWKSARKQAMQKINPRNLAVLKKYGVA